MGTNEIINGVMDNSAQNVDPSINIPRGVKSDDPGAQKAMQEAMKIRGMDVFKAGIMGAGAGAQAGQGALSPLSAFVQGAAAGLQIPSQLYAAKQKQIQSTIDATPFGITHPDIVKEPAFANLAGLPTALALETIKGIATETAKIKAQSDAEERKMLLERKAPTRDFKSEQDMALDFNKLPEVSEYKGVRSAYRQMNSAPLKIRGEGGTLKPNPAGQMALMSGYIKMMFPQARQNEGTLSLAEVGSLADQNTVQLFKRIVDGTLLDDGEVNKLMAAARAKNKSVTKQYQPIAELWGDRAEERNFNSEFVLSGDRGTGESLDDIFNAIQAQYPGMSKPEIFAIMKAQGN